ncbi:MAG TPA: carbon storage regulator [Gemmataceae bacterium]|nr:carbon storage regulator [Gemmataceae bacterium]
MLVLSRKIGECIVIPHEELTITVLAVQGNTVRLGISAPASVNVYREELWVRLGQPTHPSHAENDQQARGRS